MDLLSTTFGRMMKSRTVLVGVGTTVLGAIELLPEWMPYIQPYVPAHSKAGAVLTILLGIATVIARLRARQPLGPVIDKTIAQTVEAVHVLGISSAVPDTVAGRVEQVSQVRAVVKAVQAEPGRPTV